ncbi:hypothetical protein MTO96_006508 [Rhipicephalus appendiculatus]
MLPRCAAAAQPSGAVVPLLRGARRDRQRVRGAASPSPLRSPPPLSDAALAHPGGCWDSVAISPRLGSAPDIPLAPTATTLLARYVPACVDRQSWLLLAAVAARRIPDLSRRLPASAALSKATDTLRDVKFGNPCGQGPSARKIRDFTP